jgi:hypothetical protein
MLGYLKIAYITVVSPVWIDNQVGRERIVHRKDAPLGAQGLNSCRVAFYSDVISLV